MEWQIDDTCRRGLCATSNKAREYSYLIVKSTARSDVVLEECPTAEAAERLFASHLMRERRAMTAKKRPVPAELVLRAVVKTGRVTAHTPRGVRVSWEHERYTTRKARPITKYSPRYVRAERGG